MKNPEILCHGFVSIFTEFRMNLCPKGKSVTERTQRRNEYNPGLKSILIMTKIIGRT